VVKANVVRTVALLLPPHRATRAAAPTISTSPATTPATATDTVAAVTATIFAPLTTVSYAVRVVIDRPNGGGGVTVAVAVVVVAVVVVVVVVTSDGGSRELMQWPQQMRQPLGRWELVCCRSSQPSLAQLGRPTAALALQVL
jgi:hypothetical protein